jgi:hypothetical protein
MAKRTRDEVRFLGKTIRWNDFHACYTVDGLGLKFQTLRAAKRHLRTPADPTQTHLEAEAADSMRLDDYGRYSDIFIREAMTFLSIETLNALREIRCFHFGGRIEMTVDLLVTIRRETKNEKSFDGAQVAWNVAWNVIAFMH